MNFVAEERTVSVVVKRDGEEAFQTEQTIPAADPEGQAESLEIPGALEGADGEQFTVDVTPEGQPTDTYEYGITCADFDTEDSFSVWILNPETSEGGKRTISLWHSVVRSNSPVGQFLDTPTLWRYCPAASML